MNDEFAIIIENNDDNIIVVESSYIDSIGVVEIERFGSPSVNILTGLSPISLSDLPDIPVTKILGLNDYLDTYEFDCGTP